MSLLAFFLIIGSAIIHAVRNFATKKTEGNFHAVYIGLVIASILFFPILFFYPTTEIFKEAAFRYILASGIIHAVYFFLLAKGYKYCDLSTVYPIARGIGIAGTSIVAYFFLHEYISTIGACGILLVLVGILAVGLKRKGNKGNYIGLFFALFIGMMSIGYSITDKVGVGTISPFVYIYEFTLITTLILTPYALWQKKDLINARIDYKKQSFIIGLGYFIAYGTILYALTITQVSYVVALREVAVAMGATMGFILLHEKYTWKKIIGITLIVGGMIIIKIA